MKNSTMAIMAGVIAAAVLTLLLINSASYLAPANTTEYLSVGDIRGMAVFHQDKAYTLNFEQQNRALDYINRSVLVKKSDYSQSNKNLNFEKIVIYRFKNPTIEMLPIDYSNHNLVLAAPLINKDFYLRDLSSGSFEQLINSSFD